jgi:hypothetical protein
MKKVTATKTGAKAPAKKIAANASKRAVVAIKPMEPTYGMAPEVKDWIERANSTIMHLRGEVERMKLEVTELKAYRQFAEHRILRSERE